MRTTGASGRCDRPAGGTTKESAPAVVARHGPVVLHPGGLDSAEHDEMLPAFEPAQDTPRSR
ncbi:lipoprotein [Streptomyces sp. NPDC086777]|uniref:lipoprotein n=1 Tax=Streptomyces sp. NPDC086777 TaxID=3154866 RepID=UPI00344E525F